MKPIASHESQTVGQSNKYVYQKYISFIYLDHRYIIYPKLLDLARDFHTEDPLLVFQFSVDKPIKSLLMKLEAYNHHWSWIFLSRGIANWIELGEISYPTAAWRLVAKGITRFII